MLIYHEPSVRAVDRVVENGLVEADLGVRDLGQRTVERQGVTNLGWHSLTDALLFAAIGDAGAV
jgi:hypothetical protein